MEAISGQFITKEIHNRYFWVVLREDLKISELSFVLHWEVMSDDLKQTFIKKPDSVVGEHCMHRN